LEVDSSGDSATNFSLVLCTFLAVPYYLSKNNSKIRKNMLAPLTFLTIIDSATYTPELLSLAPRITYPPVAPYPFLVSHFLSNLFAIFVILRFSATVLQALQWKPRPALERP